MIVAAVTKLTAAGPASAGRTAEAKGLVRTIHRCSVKLGGS
jgi:hypothetical protein